MRIKNITARKILASLGDYTIEATLTFEDGSISTASVPAGVSAGKYEIKKVPTDEAINEVSRILAICQNRDWDQENLDREISNHGFGGNSTLSVSAAFFKASHQNNELKSLPKLMLLLFEGGEHGDKAHITIQEFMIIEDSVSQASEDFAKLQYYLKQNGIETTVGAEGGFSPSTLNNIEVIKTIQKVFPNKSIALDVADSFKTGEPLDYFDLINNYNIASIEDPYAEDSWDKWVEFNSLYNDRIMVVGDDLTVTNALRIKEAVGQRAINAVIIKPNQIGTITGALEAVKAARDNNLKVIVSHRGEETNDAWIADFAVFCQADFVKFGGLDRGERIAKYNRLLELSAKLS
ncbi:hypothetical protein A2872_02980 [Candidatus Gottesmanbacteria bacterium RIFCSPHIGHO2_01_FULL_42_12]|uniref:Enolase n=1 Tax=Candidatus Gottesmanbacteria bacterium RIFCSPHIGHO2_01_FULL_42_12 TaxID=1798377 RepID=A0A1F5Z5F7_9BACT|nr:MAG: hypothetical protein A2872_02980 [Candidatus Gottesmanbacteria bacterium RIFCSPHIGHO2_01_FULL_42_12]